MQLPDELKKYAILMDGVYRKNITKDQGFDLAADLAALGGTGLKAITNLVEFFGPSRLPTGLPIIRYRDDSDIRIFSTDEGHIYNSSLNDPPSTGFSAFLVQDGDKTVITFRGTDSAAESVVSNISATFFNKPGDPKHSDLGDFNSNNLLGSGTYAPTQWDDVRALVEGVIARHVDAGQTREKALENTIVVGQSLGGGLAGLASAVYGVKGYVYAPAPFAKQLAIEAKVFALNAVLARFGQHFTSEFRDGAGIFANVQNQIFEIERSLLFNNAFASGVDSQTKQLIIQEYRAAEISNNGKYKESISENLHAATIEGEELRNL